MTVSAAEIKQLEKEVEAACQVYELARQQKESPDKMNVYQARLTATRDALAYAVKPDH